MRYGGIKKEARNKAAPESDICPYSSGQAAFGFSASPDGYRSGYLPAAPPELYAMPVTRRLPGSGDGLPGQPALAAG